MNTGTPIDHKRVQGAVTALITYYITTFTEFEIGDAQLTELLGHVFVLGGTIWALYGGWIAEGPIKWFQGSDVDTSKLSDVEMKALRMLLEKVK